MLEFIHSILLVKEYTKDEKVARKGRQASKYSITNCLTRNQVSYP